jgi:hypothetical protein
MIEVKNIKHGSVEVADTLHFTGGIRGYRVNDGWAIGPMLMGGKPELFGPVFDHHIKQVASELGVTLLGVNETIFDDPNLPSHIWRAMLPERSDGLSASELWGAISSQARVAKDDGYADLARNVSISLKAADIRLRDASDEYHRQLFAALARGVIDEGRFTNIALSDLHLAFHSLLAEMGAARDYLSAIVARHVNAPTNVESFARLIGWLEKGVNSHLSTHPLIAPLLNGWTEGEPNRWLYDLGEYRNTFLHREPFGANSFERYVAISSKETRFGTTYTLKLDIAARQGAAGTVEAMEKFVEIYGNLQTLVKRIGRSAKYPPKPLAFIAR